jgi:hypothetical protein
LHLELQSWTLGLRAGGLERCPLKNLDVDLRA